MLCDCGATRSEEPCAPAMSPGPAAREQRSILKRELELVIKDSKLTLDHASEHIVQTNKARERGRPLTYARLLLGSSVRAELARLTVRLSAQQSIARSLGTALCKASCDLAVATRGTDSQFRP